MGDDIRTRARDALRAEVADAVLAVFIQRGFDAVTVEEAAVAAGISRATFFRYFGSKEDVVVAAVESTRVDLGALLLDHREAPVSGWELARAAIEPLVVGAEADPVRRRERLRLIGSNPSLRSRFVERRVQSVESLSSVLAARGIDPLGARVVAGAALAAVDVAWEEWAQAEDADFRSIVDEVFARLADAGAPDGLRREAKPSG